MYLTYFEYQEMGGALDNAAFERFAFRAEILINKYTYKRIMGESDIPKAVKRVMFELISIAEQQERTISDKGAVTSYSNDGVSETYSTMSPEVVYQSLGSQVSDIITQGLCGVYNSKQQRLLYKGRYADE